MLYIVFGLDNRFTVGRSIEKHRMRNGPRRIGHQKSGCGFKVNGQEETARNSETEMIINLVLL